MTKGQKNYELLMDTCKSLAGSQGFYGRLLEQLMELDEDGTAELIGRLEEEKFDDTLDVVLFLEC